MGQSVGDGSADALVSIAGREYEVFGSHRRSVSYVAELGDHVAATANRYLEGGNASLPGSILVALRSEARDDFDGDYRIRRVARGGVALDFRWGPELELETVCRAMTEAYLLRYVIFHHGLGAPDQMRSWVVSALGAQSYLSLRPAQYSAFLQATRTEAVEDVTRVLERQWSAEFAEATQRERSGFWVLSSMRQSGFRQPVIRRILRQALAGADVSNVLTEMIQPVDPDAGDITLQTWWSAHRTALQAADYNVCETMEVSRLWLEALADFEGLEVEGVAMESLRGLWKHRSDEAVREVLRARSELIRLRIPRVNPAYFNAARSLGALMEVALEAEHFHEFVAALTSYLGDWEDTKRLEREVRDALDA